MHQNKIPQQTKKQRIQQSKMHPEHDTNIHQNTIQHKTRKIYNKTRNNKCIETRYSNTRYNKSRYTSNPGHTDYIKTRYSKTPITMDASKQRIHLTGYNNNNKQGIYQNKTCHKTRSNEYIKTRHNKTRRNNVYFETV